MTATTAETCPCGRPVHILKTGECSRCYHRRYARQRRRPVKPRPHVPAAERFWAKVTPAPAEACWLWTSAQSNGYGTFGQALAHRYAWEERHGPIPAGLTLDHECQAKLCVNPDHLNPVPARVNTLLAHERRGLGRYQTHCIHGHELTPANTRRRDRPDGMRRDCLVCVRMRQAAMTERVECPNCGTVLARWSIRRHRRRYHPEPEE